MTLVWSKHNACALTHFFIFFLSRLKDNIPQVEDISLPNQTAAEISAVVDLETKTVGELIDLDIWHHEVYFVAPFYYITCSGLLCCSEFSNTSSAD